LKTKGWRNNRNQENAQDRISGKKIIKYKLQKDLLSVELLLIEKERQMMLH
jgi:hypothetical protein